MVEKLGNTTVMAGDVAGNFAKSPAFRDAMTELQAIANRTTAGLGTRGGTVSGKSFFNDIVQTAFARASGIPYASDKKFANWVSSHAKAFIGDLF